MIYSVGAEWQTEGIRHALIIAVAGSLGAVTVHDANCWVLPHMNGKKACNVGDVVRVSC
jgi:hypothetical protein